MVMLLLIVIPVVTGLSCALIRSRRVMEWLNLLCAAALLACAGMLAAHVLGQGTVTTLQGFLRADSLSAVVVLLTGFVALVVNVYSVGFMRREEVGGKINDTQFRRFYVLTPFFLGTMNLVPLVDNLGVMWVAMETSTLVSVMLVLFYNQKTSLEAAWKYIIIGSIGVSLALFGTVITYYSAVGILGPDAGRGMDWSVLLPLAEKFDRYPMKLAFIFILLGYGTKAGLAPMHTWKPDAYAEVPVPSAALMGAAFVNCALYAIMRFYVLAEKCLGPVFPGNLLMFLGIGSMLVAVPFIVVQRNFRRILAYSSIDHTGIMVAALGFGGPLAVMLHMVFHAVTKPLMFFCAGNVQQHYDTPHFRKVTGVMKTLPWTGALFMIGTLAVTGTAPFSMFQSEYLALSAAVEHKHYWAAGLFLLAVVTIFAGFLTHMVRMNLGKPSSPVTTRKECPWKLTAMLMVLVPVLVLTFYLPAPLYELIQRAAKIVGGHP
ncbi:MAG: hydrogenase 4 subunit F [Verrucomicrobiota bacterium]